VLNKQSLTPDKKWIPYLEADHRADNSRAIRMVQTDWSQIRVFVVA
jgi:hypothetical protein